MLYGDEKAREMGRSILPSKERQAHIRKAKHSRRSRRTVRHAMREMHWSEEGWLDDEHTLTTDKPHRAGLTYIVRSRREKDKIAPVQRWAVSITADMRLADRRAFVAKQLPQTSKGLHALTRIERLDEFDTRARLYPHFVRNGWRMRMNLRAQWSYLEMYGMLEQVIADGRLKAFNSVITGNWQRYTRRWYYPKEGPRHKVWVRHENLTPPRTLRGHDDIEQFIVDVFGRNQYVFQGLPLERERCLRYLAQVYEYEKAA